MSSYAVNERGVAHARELIDARQYVLDSNWGDIQPRAAQENAYLDSHTWEEYAAWHLGLTEGAADETKARYAFVCGDFRRVHRSGLIACVYRAAEWRHKAVERAAYDLLQRLDAAVPVVHGDHRRRAVRGRRARRDALAAVLPAAVELARAGGGRATRRRRRAAAADRRRPAALVPGVGRASCACSSLQTGVFSGPLGQRRRASSTSTPRRVVREVQEPRWLYTPALRPDRDPVQGARRPARMVALWMIGFEDEPHQSARSHRRDLRRDVRAGDRPDRHGRPPGRRPGDRRRVRPRTAGDRRPNFHVYAAEWTRTGWRSSSTTST